MVSPPTSGKHARTYAAIFAEPTRSNVVWTDIEALIVWLGATRSEGRGSRVRFELEGVKGSFHRPHPEKECDKGALQSVRRFLRQTVERDDINSHI
ncbi:type II toxin-antitoxin system HicA family toxin [Brevundimonas naejangsanensis]|uniref:type II toxin-antitoxin system HicA family toxin n=1 Tax=Brevundimonas sanguinis TaxID=3021811 RepID=UPI0035E41D87